MEYCFFKVEFCKDFIVMVMWIGFAGSQELFFSDYVVKAEVYGKYFDIILFYKYILGFGG